METPSAEKAPPEIEQLVLQLARGFQWAGLYGPGHPVLAERAGPLREAVAAQAAREPGGTLLLGFARNKVLYRSAFVGEKQPLVSPLTECLYLNQVATLGIDADVTSEGLLAFLRHLNAVRGGDTAETPETFLAREGIRGIRVYPYNYREMLSRKTDESGAPAGEAKTREDALWRMILTANVGEGKGEEQIAAELSEFPELIPAILRRARAAGPAGEASPGDRAAAGAVPADLLGRMFRRIGAALRSLPEERRSALLSAIGEEMPDGEGKDRAQDDVPLALGRSLVGDYSDDDFLDLLGRLLSVEDRGGRRARRIFRIIAGERNARGALSERLSERARQSLRAKNYYAQKTWEAVDRLLLSREETPYLDDGHARFLERLSGEGDRTPAGIAGAEPDPGLLDLIGEAATRRRSAEILLELLRSETDDEQFLDLLEEIRKMGPNLVSRGEIDLLDAVLATLQGLAGSAKPDRRSAIAGVAAELDYGQIIDLYLERATPAEDRDRITKLLVRSGDRSADPLLDRLLNEPGVNRRRALLELASRVGPSIVPAVLARLSDPRWYFVRNLCIILGDAGDPRALAGLLQALGHAEPRVRREAVLALGKLRAAEAVSPLARILLAESIFSGGKDDPLRIDAASALYRIGGTESLAALHRGTASRRAAVREHCQGLLRSMKGAP